MSIGSTLIRLAPVAARLAEEALENIAKQPTERDQILMALRMLEATTIETAADNVFRRAVSALKKAVKR